MSQALKLKDTLLNEGRQKCVHFKSTDAISVRGEGKRDIRSKNMQNECQRLCWPTYDSKGKT